MADQRLRELEREVARSGPAAGARWLLARVRAGGLSPHQLRLAAALGHPAARLAAPGAPARELDALSHVLAELGPQVVARAAAAVADAALAPWEGWDGSLFAPREAPRRALEALRAWTRGSSAAGWVRFERACAEAVEAVEHALHLVVVIDQEGPGRVTARTWRALHGASAALVALEAARHAPSDSVRAGRSLGRAFADGGALLGPAVLRPLVVAALLPWALDELPAVREA